MIIVPFLMGFLIAYLLQPLVDRFVSMGMRRDRTVLVLYVLFFAVASLFAVFLVPGLIREANASLQSLPLYTAKFNTLNDKLSIELSLLMKRLLGSKAHAVSLPFRADALADRFVASIPENISNVVQVGIWLFVIPFVCFFALSQGKNWMNNLFDATPSTHVENLLGLLAEINATIGAYIRGQLLDALCVGTLTMLGLLLLGFEQAILMGVLAGFLNPIPFLAPLVAGSASLLMAYFQGASGSTLVGIFCLFALVRLCDDFIFTPFIVGQTVQLHPVVMLFAILAGVELGGFVGLVFAVPAAAILKVVLSAVLNSRPEKMNLSHNHIVS